MFKNYLRIASRNIWKNKGYAFLHIIGLSVAFCISIFLFLTAYFQLTFDRFHSDSDRIFQAYFAFNSPDGLERKALMPYTVTSALKSEYPEIGAIAGLQNVSERIEYKGKYFEKKVILTDPGFFTVFSFPVTKGRKELALNNLSSIVISQETANAIFGNEEPVGKQLRLGGDGYQREFIVSAIIQDQPDNSTIKYDALIRTENGENFQLQKDNWELRSQKVFLKLTDTSSPTLLETRLRSFVKKYLNKDIEDLRNRGAQPDSDGNLFSIRLQKLSKIHFDPELSGGGVPVSVIYTLLAIAIFILLIACINFINLNIARSFMRAKEIGVRKSLGASKNQLVVQIWSEAAFICLLGFAVGMAACIIFLPRYNAIFNGKLTLDYVFEIDKLGLIFAVFVLVTILAGGYPAWKMSKFNTIEVLKGKVSLQRPGFLRNTLIVTQFALAGLLICCTIISVQQIDHLLEQPLGFNTMGIVSIPVGTTVNGRDALKRMRDKLATDPHVLAVSGSDVNLGYGLDKSFSRNTRNVTYLDREVTADWLRIDYGYLKTLSIGLKAGREFDPMYPTDSIDRIVITESLAKAMAENDVVGKTVQLDTSHIQYQIIGVIPDFNLHSSKSRKRPIVMHISESAPINYIFVKFTRHGLTGSVERLKDVWREVARDSNFLGSFTEANISAWYEFEKRLLKIFTLASSIAVVLSCLGLFAVALIVSEQRIKEIGIRKVLGASVTNLVYVLSRDFVKMVLLAMGIAIPLSWFGMKIWLNLYVYRIEISPMIFVFVGFAAVLIAVITVSFQSIKAALMNPVKSLKSE